MIASTTIIRSPWRDCLAVAGLLGWATLLAWPLPARSQLLEPVTLQLPWKPQSQFVGYYLAASLHDGCYAMEHPEEIISLIVAQYSPRHSRNPLRYEAEQAQQRVQSAQVKPGLMDPDRWQHIAETYAEPDSLPEAVSFNGSLHDPEPKAAGWHQRYRTLALILALLMLGGLISLNIYRLNRRLHREVQERRIAETRFRGLVEQSLVGIYIIQDDRFVYVNPKFAEIFGYAVADIIDRLGPLDLTAEAGREQVQENLCRRLDGDISDIQYTFSAIRKDGALIDVEVNGKIVDYEGHPAIIGVVLDITEQHRAQRQLNYLAFYDQLTDLPNRTLFFDRFAQALTQSNRSGEPFALLMLDLDGFKAVNDTHGHETGDALLVMVGQRLRACIRESDTVARMGGDEFALLLQNIQEVENAPRVAEKILAALTEPFMAHDYECRVGASIGICIAPQDGNDMETLMSRVDAAMYQSKARGKNTYTHYHPTLKTLQPAKKAFLEWSEELCVGSPLIDEQHARLAMLLNRIDDALRTGQSKIHVMARFDDLIAFTRYHFESEEQLMSEYGYDDTVIHQQAHRKLLDDLLSIQRQCASVSLIMTLQALKNWLKHHITERDRCLAEAISAKDALKTEQK